MATDTIAGHLAVIESRRGPGSRAMAVHALVAALDVIGGFPCCLGVVMATGATAAHQGVVQAGHLPVDGGMAVVTGGRGRNMVRRLGGIRQGPAAAVAGLAQFWCALENTLLMAGIAFDGGMGTGQGIAGFCMVEFGEIGAGTKALAGPQCGKYQ